MPLSSLDPPWSLELIDRAEKTLRQLAQTEAFHARAAAEALDRSHDAVDAPLRALEDAPSAHDPERARLVALLRERRLALQRNAADEGDPPLVHADGGSLTVLALLRQDRRHVERTCEGLRSALSTLDDFTSPALDRLIASGFFALAEQLSTSLELRSVAAGFVDPTGARRLERDRAAWDRIGRDIAKLSLDHRGCRAVHQRDVTPGEPEQEGPLCRRVILIVASDPRALAFLTALTEGLGAMTVLADSRASTLELLRWFHVDAVFCAIEHVADPCIGLPAAYVATDEALRPLFVALPASTLLGAAELGEEHGFDATVPLAGADADAFGWRVARALDARDAEPLLS